MPVPPADVAPADPGDAGADDAGHEGRDADGFLTPARVRGLFDRAVAHFNAGRFFESHEDWETIWHECDGAHRLWVQGLIQLAAAFHHVDHGTASGLVKLLRSSREKLGAPTRETHGLDVARLAADLDPWWAFGDAVAAGAPKRGVGTPPFPSLAYVAGITPAPLPFEDEPGDDDPPA